MKNCIKSLTIIIAFSLILNSCSVYYKEEVTFDEAYLSKKPVKLVTNENKKIHLKKIILKDSAYYGYYWHEGKAITFPLSKEKYRSVRIKNRTASTLINVGGSILTLGILGTIILIITIGNDLNDDWEWKTTNQNSTY